MEKENMAINPWCCWQVYNEVSKSNWIGPNYTRLQILLNLYQSLQRQWVYVCDKPSVNGTHALGKHTCICFCTFAPHTQTHTHTNTDRDTLCHDLLTSGWSIPWVLSYLIREVALKRKLDYINWINLVILDHCFPAIRSDRSTTLRWCVWYVCVCTAKNANLQFPIKTWTTLRAPSDDVAAYQ